jgi:RNA polymerase sigma-70 factor (ECF subfamily)
VERYTPRAIQLARRLTGNQETAREMAQEALVHAYLSVQQLRKVDAFASWLYGIVLNVYRTHRRQRRQNFLSLEALNGGLYVDALPLTSSEPEPHVVVELRELHDQVLAAVHTLAPLNRDATLLFYYEQLSLQEIAAILGISVVAVKSRLHKARLQLRKQLTAWYTTIQPSEHVVERRAKMIPMSIADIVVKGESGNRIILLLDEVGRRALPIWIGPFEAMP